MKERTILHGETRVIIRGSDEFVDKWVEMMQNG